MRNYVANFCFIALSLPTEYQALTFKSRTYFETLGWGNSPPPGSSPLRGNTERQARCIISFNLLASAQIMHIQLVHHAVDVEEFAQFSTTASGAFGRLIT